ncbi:MAG: DUF2752 domain-containing protein [Actinomycetes bacterium]
MTSHRPPSIWFEVEQRDRWWPTTLLAIAVVAIAVAMAVIGLPSADTHTPLHHMGIMDPGCGGTRAIRLAAMGQWTESWRYNPIGIPLFVGCVVVILRAAVGWVSGRWLTLRISWTHRGKVVGWIVLVATIVALEINQQSNAALLMSR